MSKLFENVIKPRKKIAVSIKLIKIKCLKYISSHSAFEATSFGVLETAKIVVLEILDILFGFSSKPPCI